MHSQLTKRIIERYISAFGAKEYLIQLTHLDRKKYVPIRICYEPEALLRSTDFLKYKNLLGYNVYCRPVGYEYILLDDLKREVFPDLEIIKPCLWMETSPDNFQAFVTLSQAPENREQALEICRHLAHRFRADPGSAEPDHVGRLPGFTNRKEKYRDEKGFYPFVKLHQAEKRISSFLPQWGACAQTTSIHNVPPRNEEDRSRRDFNYVCMLLRQGKTEDFIREALYSYSSKAKQRGDKYVSMTIRNARKVIGH
jgi:hypothetical protein